MSKTNKVTEFRKFLKFSKSSNYHNFFSFALLEIWTTFLESARQTLSEKYNQPDFLKILEKSQKSENP